MRISRKVWLTVIVVVLLVALGNVARMYIQQSREEADLRRDIAQQQALLHKLTADKTKAQDQLAQAESLLDTSQKGFPQSLTSIEYGEDLFAIAEDCGVQLTDLSQSAPAAKSVGAVTYSAGSVAIQVAGTTEDILEFIYALRTGDGFRLPWSAEIKSITMDVSGNSASITLDIYAYSR